MLVTCSFHRSPRPNWILIASLFSLLFHPAILPASTQTREVFQGITHIERTDWPIIPRSVRANILIVNLTEPGISFRVTEPTATSDPADPEQRLTQGERTLDYLNRVKAQVAVNANFYTTVSGLRRLYSLAASEGTPYSKFEDPAPALNIDPDNNARIVTRGASGATYQTSPTVTLDNAVGGNERIVFQGENTANDGDGTGYYQPRARTIAGLTQDNQTLVIITIDETSGSLGVTPRESAEMLLAYGVWDGINLDGGGSTTLAMADPDPRLVNTPSANPPRQVGCNLAIFAEPAPPPEEPEFSNIRVSPGMAEALVSWETEEPASVWVEYGRNASFINSRSLRLDNPRTDHTLLLTGLTPGVTYYYQLVALIDGEEVRSATREFNTAGVEVIVDDSEAGASFSGSWNINSLGTGWGPTYRWASVSDTPTAVGTFTPEIPLSGYYQVQTWYLASGNRATNTRFTIEHADGETTVRISQQSSGSTWRHLESNLRFDEGDTRPVRIFNDATGGDVVIADAVRWNLTEAFPLPHGEVPDWWMLHFFGTTAHAPDADLNGDGFTLADEYFLGIAPVAAELKFEFRMKRQEDGELNFEVSPTYPDRQYILETTENLMEWNTAADQVFTRDAETGKSTIVIPPPTSEREFYRLQIVR